jgi:H+/Cl- antiporter ClcA
MFRRGPVRFAVAAAVLFAALALVQEDVLFSGQQAIQHLDGLPNGDLLYLTVAKWVALLIAYLGGWRGGPIFPLFFSVSSFAVLLDGPLGVPADVVMIAGIAAVSTVFARGSIPIAFVLSLYVVPVSYALTVLIGATAGAIALRMARARDVLPTAGETPAPAPAGP